MSFEKINTKQNIYKKHNIFHIAINRNTHEEPMEFI